MKKAIYLVTTDHLTDRLWFRDEEDFKVGMCYVAILAATFHVDVIAFVLMSNHVHFVLRCDRKTAYLFCNTFKQKYSLYHHKKYAGKGLLRDNNVDIREVSIGDESFERAVAYVHMNPVAANICVDSSGYPWGTGELFFRNYALPPTTVGSLGVNEKRRLLHSKTDLPDNYRVDSRGYISPASYVPISFVESVFKTPRRMNYFLTNSSKAKRINEAPSFNDQWVFAGIKSLCISLCRSSNLSDLTVNQKAEVLKQARYRFSSDPLQIARVTGIPYAEVCSFLEAW